MIRPFRIALTGLVALALAACSQTASLPPEAEIARLAVDAPPVPTGNVLGWGISDIANGPAGLTDVVAVEAGEVHTLALRSNGEVVAWGRNYGTGAEIVPDGLTDVVAISTKLGHNLALRSDGTVVAWGSNSHGQATVPNGLEGVVAIAAGGSHSLALTDQGTVVSWGSASFGQNVPVDLDKVVAIAAGNNTSYVLRSDGRVLSWGYAHYDTHVGVDQLRNVVDIAVGLHHVVALHADGEVTVLGAVTEYRSGDGVRFAPQASNVAAIFAGGFETAYRLTDGSLVFSSNARYPDDLTGVLSLSPGLNHSVALVASTPAFDTTAPVADPVVVAGDLGLDGWFTSAVTVDWRWSDGPDGSGIDPAACAATSTTLGDGAQTLSATCRDQAGNLGSATFAVKVDATAPTLAPVVDPNPVLLGGVATVTANAFDAVSGVASATCGQLDSETVGTKTVTCEASDEAGNLASVEVPYAVHFPYSGFGRPVDDQTVNRVQAGRGVVLRFSLGGDRGLDILAVGSPSSQAVACGTDVVVDAAEMTNAAGASELRYDEATGEYVYVWKTERSWRGSCRTLTLALVDGSQHQAVFHLR